MKREHEHDDDEYVYLFDGRLHTTPAQQGWHDIRTGNNPIGRIDGDGYFLTSNEFSGERFFTAESPIGKTLRVEFELLNSVQPDATVGFGMGFYLNNKIVRFMFTANGITYDDINWYTFVEREKNEVGKIYTADMEFGDTSVTLYFNKKTYTVDYNLFRSVDAGPQWHFSSDCGQISKTYSFKIS